MDFAESCAGLTRCPRSFDLALTLTSVPLPMFRSLPSQRRYKSFRGGRDSYFEDTGSELFAKVGIPTAKYHIIDSWSQAVVPFDGPYVVKLATSLTEQSMTRYESMYRKWRSRSRSGARQLARQSGLPPKVAVQPLVKGFGEAFIGVRSSTELGPVVAFGLGGVFVEVMHRVSGRLAPLSAEDAQELISEFDDTGVLEGFRGSNG